MYIKKVTKKNGVTNKVYSYLHLVENIRTKKGPRQKLILNLGDLPNIHPSQYKSLANRIENILKGQTDLFEIDLEIEKTAQSAVKKIFKKQSTEQKTKGSEYKSVNVNSLNAGSVRSLGPEYVCTKIWEELKIDDFLIDNNVFIISRIVLFFISVIFIYKAMQAIDYSKIFRRNSGDQIKFMFMVIAIILGYLFVDAVMSIFEWLNSLL